MRSCSISKALTTTAMVLPRAAIRFLTSAARPVLNLEKAMLLALASFLLPCHLRRSEGTAEVLEYASKLLGLSGKLRASIPAVHEAKRSAQEDSLGQYAYDPQAVAAPMLVSWSLRASLPLQVLPLRVLPLRVLPF